MKKLLLKFVVFIILMIIILESFSTLVLSSNNVFSEKISWYRFYEVGLRSHTNLESDTLFLGGSVANQLYRPKMARNYLTSSGSTYPAGNYIMAKNALENNPELKCIVYIFGPGELVFNFERKKTYSCFVKPLFTFRNLNKFDELLIGKIAKKPLALLSIFNFFKILPLDDLDYSDQDLMRPKTVADFSMTYLKKLYDLSKVHNVRIIFASPPLSESMKKRIDLPMLHAQLKNYGLDDVLKDYFDNIVYLPNECFIDDSHYKNIYLNKNLYNIRKMMKQLK